MFDIFSLRFSCYQLIQPSAFTLVLLHLFFWRFSLDFARKKLFVSMAFLVWCVMTLSCHCNRNFSKKTSVIHSASPQTRPAVIGDWFWDGHTEIRWDKRTDGTDILTICVKIVITTGRDYVVDQFLKKTSMMLGDDPTVLGTTAFHSTILHLLSRWFKGSAPTSVLLPQFFNYISSSLFYDHHCSTTLPTFFTRVLFL